MRFDDLKEGKYPFASWHIHGDEEPHNILAGKYCEVHCRLLSKCEKKDNVFFSPYWLDIGSNSETATDEEWLAYTISNFPNADYFINFNSFDQVKEWIGFKDQAVALAYCFLAEPEQPSDQLYKELNAGQIDQFSYDYDWASANLYKSFWAILKKDEQKIVRSLKAYKQSYPFNSSRELMAEIVREIYEGEFFQCLERRSIYNASQIKKIAKLKRKSHKKKLTDQEQKTLYNLMDRHTRRAEIYDETLARCQKLAVQDSVTEILLENLYRCIDVVSKLQIQRDCKPELRENHVRASHVWEQGKKIEGLMNWMLNKS